MTTAVDAWRMATHTRKENFLELQASLIILKEVGREIDAHMKLGHFNTYISSNTDNYWLPAAPAEYCPGVCATPKKGEPPLPKPFDHYLVWRLVRRQLRIDGFTLENLDAPSTQKLVFKQGPTRMRVYWDDPNPKLPSLDDSLYEQK